MALVLSLGAGGSRFCRAGRSDVPTTDSRATRGVHIAGSGNELRQLSKSGTVASFSRAVRSRMDAEHRRKSSILQADLGN